MSMTVEEAIAIIEDVTWKDFGRHYGKVPIAREMAIKALEEIQQYRAIGTVSEFAQLKEKATAKKPILYPFPKCPSCNHVLPYALVKYCCNCGTALDWSEGKE